MSKVSDLIESEVRAAERADDSADAPLPDSVRVRRGHDRSKVLQIRLNEDEYRLLAKHADEQKLPVSTLARAVLLRTIGS
jgi:hypothetical protein